MPIGEFPRPKEDGLVLPDKVKKDPRFSDHEKWIPPVEKYIDTKSLSGEERDKFILDYLGLVKIIAMQITRKYPYPEVELDELVQNGVLGLMGAMNRYEPSKGNQFSTFAGHRIHGAILDFLRGHHFLSKRTKKRRDGMQSVDAYPGAVDDLLGAVEDGTEESIYKKDVAKIVGSAFKEFLRTVADEDKRKRYISVYKQYYFKGILLKEIGVNHSVNESRAQQILVQIREGIGNILISKGFNPEDFNLQ